MVRFISMSIEHLLSFNPMTINTLADSGFFKNFLYQGGVKSTVFWVIEDLKFKISEGYDQKTERANWAESGKHQFLVVAF